MIKSLIDILPLDILDYIITIKIYNELFDKFYKYYIEYNYIYVIEDILIDLFIFKSDIKELYINHSLKYCKYHLISIKLDLRDLLDDLVKYYKLVNKIEDEDDDKDKDKEDNDKIINIIYMDVIKKINNVWLKDIIRFIKDNLIYLNDDYKTKYELLDEYEIDINIRKIILNISNYIIENTNN